MIEHEWYTSSQNYHPSLKKIIAPLLHTILLLISVGIGPSLAWKVNGRSGISSRHIARDKELFLPLWIRRSSSARRDTTFFLRAPRYDILQPSGEIRHSSSARWDSTFFIRTARCDVVPLSRRLAQLQNKHNIPAKDELDISVQFRVMLYINL